MGWLKKDCFLEVKRKPLLPLLYEMLENSGCICRAYLDSSSRRMTRIAEVMALIAAWHLPDDFSLYERLQAAGKLDREFISSKLCHFDDRTFRQFGEDIRQTIVNEEVQSWVLTR